MKEDYKYVLVMFPIHQEVVLHAGHYKYQLWIVTVDILGREEVFQPFGFDSGFTR
jgi:hypothetical protein